MNNPEREPPSTSRGGSGSEGLPSSGSATTIHNSSVPSSAMAATTTSADTINTNNKLATMPTKPTNQQQTKRSSSSTESEGYVKERRPLQPPRHSDEEEDNEEDDDDDDERVDEGDDDAEEEEEMEGVRRSSESSGGGEGGGVGAGSDGSSSAPHQSVADSSSTSGSPVRRLPPMLRPPTAQPTSQQLQQAPSSSVMYGNNSNARQPLPHYYGGGGGALGQASPRDAVSPSPSGLMDGGRVLAQKRRLQQQQPSGQQPQPQNDYAAPSQQLQQLNQTATASARALYEASQHHPSSNSSSSTARSAGALGTGSHQLLHSTNNSISHTSLHRTSTLDDDDDDDNDDPLRFETRGSHGPRDEARYETWTSKQLRKKCSHLKLRGLKNVKKHVMVEALYRYYRNQRAKMGASDGGSGGSGTSGSQHLRSASGNNNNHNSHGPSSNNSGARALSSNRNDDSALYGESYTQQQHRYEHSMNASSVSSNYRTNLSAMGMRGAQGQGRGNSTNNNNSHNAPTLNTSTMQASHQQGRRSSPSSLTPPSRQIMRASSGGGTSLPGGVGGGTYHSKIDLEESKYDALDNEVRITSEDVIRLVDVILSPEFVDRLSSELSRWQFWVDVREKYISLAGVIGPSSYGAARGLTALGGDHHAQQGERQGGVGSSSVDNSRLPVTSTYVRPSAKWSSMQLWEMWKELTFAYTKTCFEFTAAGVDERNYIQFCEGRPDVYYLHQRLHARPDLLHLIKSNEYIEEKCSSDAASEHTNMNAEKNAANALMGVSSPPAQSSRPHKRFKRIVPAGSNGGDRQGASSSGGNGGGAGATGGNYASGSSGMNGVESGGASGGNAGANANASSNSDNAPPPQIATGNNNSSVRPSGSNGGGGGVGGGGGGGGGGGPVQYLAANGIRVGTSNSASGQQEEGSTENSETTGEEGSLEKSNSNATSSDSVRREELAEQKYFGLLLQNFEAIFESLHNKKVLLAALRKDNSAPDHLIADLHDDIHVLSALKKDFRNKLRQALE